VRGDVAMSGYGQDPGVTASVLRDGWLHTGEVGRLDDRQVLSLVDRANDPVISGGLSVFPSEVEVVVRAHPAAREAAVLSLPDEEWSELVAAAVVIEPGIQLDRAELTVWCKAHMASYKKPLDDALPCNAYGRVLRRDARAILPEDHDEERPV
jgi:long-chain acyl-CoA synthetase